MSSQKWGFSSKPLHVQISKEQQEAEDNELYVPHDTLGSVLYSTGKYADISHTHSQWLLAHWRIQGGSLGLHTPLLPLRLVILCGCTYPHSSVTFSM